MSYMELKADENMEKALDAIGLFFCVTFLFNAELLGNHFTSSSFLRICSWWKGLSEGGLLFIFIY